MEFGSIDREIHIEATPEVVYDVVSSPEHLREWWSDHAELEPVEGGVGTITFGEPASPDAKSEVLAVVEANPFSRFAFRWVRSGDGAMDVGNSLLVTFDLESSGSGTLLRFSETGFRERGWKAAVLEQTYHDHVRGWDHFLPRLVSYAGQLVARQ